MKKFLIQIALFFSIGIGLFQLIGRGADTYFKDRPSRGLKTNIPWVLQQKNNNLDFAILGSSRAFNNVSVRVLEEKWQAEGINLGAGGASYAQQYVLLKLFLDNNNSTKQLLVNLDYSSLHSPTSYLDAFAEQDFLSYSNKSYVKEAFSDYLGTPKVYLYELAPIAKYMEYNNFYGLTNNFLKSDKEYLEYHHFLEEAAGTHQLTPKDRQAFKPKKGDRFEVSPDSLDLKYLGLIQQTCSKSNIELSFFISPVKEQVVKLREYDRVNAEIKALDILKGYRVIDCTNLIADESYFHDGAHLNSKGSDFFSVQLADSLDLVR